jgi:N-acetyl-anhydromuramyl-L-alanine amidase AmpD
MEDKPVEDVVKELTRWHVEDNKWSDCGYHYVIHRDGMIGTARPVERSGAHCRGRNKQSISVTLCGGRGGESTDKILDNFTPEQASALRNLIDDLKKKHPKIQNISGHNQWSNKACPCFSVREWLR